MVVCHSPPIEWKCGGFIFGAVHRPDRRGAVVSSRSVAKAFRAGVGSVKLTDSRISAAPVGRTLRGQPGRRHFCAPSSRPDLEAPELLVRAGQTAAASTSALASPAPATSTRSSGTSSAKPSSPGCNNVQYRRDAEHSACRRRPFRPISGVIRVFVTRHASGLHQPTTSRCLRTSTATLQIRGAASDRAEKSLARESAPPRPRSRSTRPLSWRMSGRPGVSRWRRGRRGCALRAAGSNGRARSCAGAPMRRHLDALVVGDELERLLERHRPRRGELLDVVGADARMLVSFFSLVGLTSMSSARAFSPTIMPS